MEAGGSGSAPPPCSTSCTDSANEWVCECGGGWWLALCARAGLRLSPVWISELRHLRGRLQ
eukprot:3893035-Alexandrium_andersonii.AAC.1